MAENTKIQWAHHTWSQWRGCEKVSPGCKFCYAEKLSHRNPAVLGEWGKDGKRVVNADWNKPLTWDRKAAKAGERWRIFPSLCDPFEDREDLDSPRIRFLELIHATPNLDWLVLTKRPENWLPLMHRISGKWATEGGHIAGRWLDGDVIPNLWLGVSIENQKYADERLAVLARIPNALPWVSYEPAIGPVDFRPHLDSIDWIICGGESGRSEARAFDLTWGRSARDQCRAACVPFFMKQLGSFAVEEMEPYGDRLRIVQTKDPKGGDMNEWPEDLRVREFPRLKGSSS